MTDWQSLQQQYSQRIDKLLKQQIQQLPPQPQKLHQAMEYALLMGGKRIRPFLVYACGEMLGVQQKDLDVCALAIECIHAYSLVHDDLPAMDDDDLRRGHPTCHIAFDEATAILVGDALQTLAFDILANMPLNQHVDDKRIQLIRILTRASGFQGMCGGQAMDLDATDKQISLPQLEQLHLLKTGALIQAAVSMAAELAPDCNPEQQKLLQDYAQSIGLAFQVQDDILDITSDTQTLGKPQGSDLSQNKSTYPELLGLEGAQQLAQQLLQQSLQALQALPYNTNILQAFAGYIVNRNH